MISLGTDGSSWPCPRWRVQPSPLSFTGKLTAAVNQCYTTCGTFNSDVCSDQIVVLMWEDEIFFVSVIRRKIGQCWGFTAGRRRAHQSHRTDAPSDPCWAPHAGLQLDEELLTSSFTPPPPHPLTHPTPPHHHQFPCFHSVFSMLINRVTEETSGWCRDAAAIRMSHCIWSWIKQTDDSLSLYIPQMPLSHLTDRTAPSVSFKNGCSEIEMFT